MNLGLGIAALPVLCVLLSCASLSFTAPDPYRIPEDFFGISPDRSPLNTEDYALLDRFGAVWIRTTVRWASLEPEEGVWEFDRWDLYVEKAKAAGKKIIFILAFDSKWLYPDHREHRDLTEREIPYFLKYVEQMVTRYRGRVDAFEIWNEPNGFFWYGSDKHFFALSAAAAKKIKELDPQVTVLAGSTFRVPRSFLIKMFNAGAFEYTDGISIHPYASDAAHTVRQIRKLRKILNAVGYDKPIWITEVGYATGGIYFSFNGLKRYPEYIVKTLSGLAVQGVRNAVWYELMDEYNRDTVPDHWNPSHFFGLTYPDRTLKPGAEAFMLSARYLAGAEYRPELPLRDELPDSVTSLYFRREDGTKILLVWNNRSRRIPLLLHIDGSDGTGLVRHDIESGKAEILGPGDRPQLLRAGRDPLFLTWTGEGSPRLRGNIGENP
ncbi:MAG: cellulase family glycosylhydrolase [Spirochaetaceae bacterium]|nr:cellulase family glycosylhydrolase [Spirochaetaceae bacterium]